MLKTFTLNKRIYKNISKERGTVEFYITDENKESREIIGDTFLDDKNIPQGISSTNKRELPLIEGLFRLEVGESIEIEFKHYNGLYNRNLDKTANQIAYDTITNIQKKNSYLLKILNIFKKRIVTP